MSKTSDVTEQTDVIGPFTAAGLGCAAVISSAIGCTTALCPGCNASALASRSSICAWPGLKSMDAPGPTAALFALAKPRVAVHGFGELAIAIMRITCPKR